METPPEVIDARPAAIRFAKEIGAMANKKYENRGGLMAALIGSLTLQNLIVSLLVGPYEPGKPEGLAELIKFYDEVKRDAVERWYDDDLKFHFARRRK